MKSATRLDGLTMLLDRFDAFVLDQWGVLHDGNALYTGVLDVLTLLRDHRKLTVIVTNSSKTADRNIRRLNSTFHVPANSYDALISSAQLLRDALAGETGLPAVPRSRPYVVATDGDEVLVADLPLTPVDTVDQADSVVLLSVDLEYSMSAAERWIDEAVRRGLPLLCPSADVHSVRPDGVVSGMAYIICRYRALGGQVINFGKPDKLVYDHCATHLPGITPDRILAVGDQLASDVAGAQSIGWSAALVETGAGALSLADPDSSHVTPEYILPSLRP